MTSRVKPIDAELGERLRAFRKAADMNQTELGAAVGVTFQQIQKYERGTNRISAGTLFEFARVLNIDVSQFFKGLRSTSHKTKPALGRSRPQRALKVRAS